jgi:hypothetical protein
LRLCLMDIRHDARNAATCGEARAAACRPSDDFVGTVSEVMDPIRQIPGRPASTC